MTTDEIISQFITDTVNRNFEKVKSLQLERLNSAPEKVRKHFDTEKINRSVKQNTMQTESVNNGVLKYKQNIIKDLRFLDMKKLGNMKVYNKVVWGYLAVIRDELQYELSDEIREAIKTKLREAGSPLNFSFNL
jgi:hypothetical protein